MSLGEEDVAGRAVVHGVEVALVNGSFEARACVDDDSSFWRADQEGVRESLREIDEVVDLPGLFL